MENINIDAEKLLSDKRVVEEIHRHLWIESQKAGYDIGFDKAKEDWLKNFSKAWMEYHMPQELLKAKKQNDKKFFRPSEQAANASKPKQAPAAKRRHAKSYFKD